MVPPLLTEAAEVEVGGRMIAELELEWEIEWVIGNEVEDEEGEILVEEEDEEEGVSLNGAGTTCYVSFVDALSLLRVTKLTLGVA